jgi:hypothetical protein
MCGRFVGNFNLVGHHNAGALTAPGEDISSRFVQNASNQLIFAQAFQEIEYHKRKRMELEHDTKVAKRQRDLVWGSQM